MEIYNFYLLQFLSLQLTKTTQVNLQEEHKNSQDVKKVKPMPHKRPGWKSCKIQAKLWWYVSSINFNNENSVEFG